jgi:hypothetical protein
MSSDFNEKLQKASIKYSELSILRAAIQTIPTVGSAIDTLLAEKAAKFQERRILSFIETTKRLISQLDQEKISKAFLDSEDFFTLFHATMERVVRSQHEEKIALLSAVFLGAVASPDDLVTPQIALDVISNLQPVHIKVLRMFDEMRQKNGGYIYNFVNPKGGSGGGGGSHANMLWVLSQQKGMDSTVFELVCGDLARLNLLDAVEGGVHPPDINGGFLKGYRPTKIGEIVLGYLKFVAMGN